MGDISFPGVKVRSAQRRGDQNGPLQKRSVFHITINSNKKPRSIKYKEQLVAGMQTFVEEQFEDQQFLTQLIEFKIPGHNWSQVTAPIKLSYAVEQGSARGRVHAHITMKIQHISYIRMKPQVIADMAEQLLGYRPYVHVQSFTDAAFAAEEYARKANLAAAAPKAAASVSSNKK